MDGLRPSLMWQVAIETITSKETQKTIMINGAPKIFTVTVSREMEGGA